MVEVLSCEGVARHVAIRTDCAPEMGVGHLLRSLAFAEELTGRGHRVTLIGSTNGMDWRGSEAG